MLKIFIDSNIQVIVRMALADPGGRGGLGVATPPTPPWAAQRNTKTGKNRIPCQVWESGNFPFNNILNPFQHGMSI